VAEPVVGIVGLKALRRDVAQLTTDTSSALYEGIKAAGRLAAGPVASATRSALPRVTGTLAGDVRTSGTRTGAAVRMGRAAVAYAGWIEFGGSLPGGQARDYIPTGRYLFPAARSLSARAAADYSRALETVFNRSGIWTNTTSDGGQVHD
jgi:hypothetical protein